MRRRDTKLTWRGLPQDGESWGAWVRRTTPARIMRRVETAYWNGVAEEDWPGLHRVKREYRRRRR